MHYTPLPLSVTDIGRCTCSLKKAHVSFGRLDSNTHVTKIVKLFYPRTNTAVTKHRWPYYDQW